MYRDEFRYPDFQVEIWKAGEQPMLHRHPKAVHPDHDARERSLGGGRDERFGGMPDIVKSFPDHVEVSAAAGR